MAVKELQILINAKDNASKTLAGLEGAMKKAEGASKGFAVGLAAVATGMAVFGSKAIAAYQESEKAEARLVQIAKKVTGATDEQIDGYKRLAGELQNIGVVEDDVVKAGQSQLASFAKNSETVNILSKDLADLAVAQYGVEVSGDQAIQTANLMGKALSGQLGALTRTGVLVSDEYAKAFEEANGEQERAIVLSQIISDNYGGLNEAMRKTSAGGVQALKNSFGDFMEVVGQKLLPILTKLVDNLNNFVDNVLPNLISRFEETIEWFKNNEWAIYAIAGAIVGALVPAVYAMISSLVTAAIALAPFLIGGAIIGGIIAGVMWIIENWEMLKASAMQIFQVIADFFVGIWTAISDTTKKVWSGISSFFEGVWDTIKKLFQFSLAFIFGFWIAIFELMGIDIIAVFQKIQESLGLAWEFITNLFQTSMEFLSNLWTSVWDGIANFMGPIWERIRTALSVAFNWLNNLFKTATDPLREAWTNIWLAIGNTVETVWEGIKATIKAGINWILDKINVVIRMANKVAQMGAVVGFTPPKIPEIPMLANGGIVNKPTLAMIGEAGPEAVVPLGKKGAGLGNVFNIYLSNNTLLDDRAGEKVGNMIIKKLKQSNALG